ncbi:MAG: hypothetical protein WBO88_09865, partial [Candidatus Dechloromonas phosphoritropha]
MKSLPPPRVPAPHASLAAQGQCRLADGQCGDAVIISASGMCEAGRIKYHLRESLPRGECSILIAGFQAAGDSGQGAHLHHRRAVGTCQPRGT